MKNWEKIEDGLLIQRHIEDIGNSDFQKITSYEQKKILETLKGELNRGDLVWIIGGTEYDFDSEASQQISERCSDIMVLDNLAHIDFNETNRIQFVCSWIIIKDNDDYFWVNVKLDSFISPDHYDAYEYTYYKCDQLKGLIDFIEDDSK